MRIDILSLFPQYFAGPFDESMIKQARNNGLIDIRLTNIRDFSEDRYKRVDDRPYGGGPGMVMMPEPVAKAIRSVKTPEAKVIYLTPQGMPLTAAKCRELAAEKHLVLLCGHYEGVDERAIDSEVDEEISIGDYVLTNGCLSAIVLVDAVARFVPGVIGHELAASQDSFEQEILDCPHYTRPEQFEGVGIPPVLLTGDHAKINEWRRQKAVEKTRQVRPELYLRYIAIEQAQEEKNKKRNRVPPAIKGWHRAALTVPDLKRSIAFYRDIIGLPLVTQGKTSATFAIGPQELYLESGMKTESASVVLELQVFDKKALELLAARVLEARCGKIVTSPNVQTALGIEFKDPDGYLWYATLPKDHKS